MRNEYAALLPIAIIAIGFAVYCLNDLYHAEQVRYFPRWVWAILCVASIPLGGIAYLIFGKER